MNREVMFSSATGVWATPQDFFDPCANAENHKCERYFTEAEDGLAQDWGGNVYSVTRRMAGRSTSGLKSVTGKGAKTERSWCC